MLSKSLYLKDIKNLIKERQKEDAKFIKRMEKALKWWDVVSDENTAAGFVGVTCTIKKVRCKCIHSVSRPQYHQFTLGFMPLNADDDLGTGKGMRHEINF